MEDMAEPIVKGSIDQALTAKEENQGETTDSDPDPRAHRLEVEGLRGGSGGRRLSRRRASSAETVLEYAQAIDGLA
jgi:hypothetical protein